MEDPTTLNNDPKSGSPESSSRTRRSPPGPGIIQLKDEEICYVHENLDELLTSDDSPEIEIKPRLEGLVLDEDELPNQRHHEEDVRLDFLLRQKHAMSEAFDNPAYVHPHGLTEFDYKVLSECGKSKLEKFKMNVRRDNYKYLQANSELDAMMSLFLQKVLKAQPEDPVKFAAEFFTQHGTTQEGFLKQIHDEKKALKYRRRVNVKKMGQFSWPPPPNKDVKNINDVKRLGLGPMTEALIPPPPPPPVEIEKPKKEKPVVEIKPPLAGKKFYCGCKDPGRRRRHSSKQKSNFEETEEEALNFTYNFDTDVEEAFTDDEEDEDESEFEVETDQEQITT